MQLKLHNFERNFSLQFSAALAFAFFLSIRAELAHAVSKLQLSTETIISFSSYFSLFSTDLR